MESAPAKLMVLAILAIAALPAASSEDVSGLEKYLDCSNEKKVDIVFVFDTTNSMGGEINEMAAIARSFAEDLNASHIDFRLGLVEFRDFPMKCESRDSTECGSPGDFPYRVKGGGNLTGDVSVFNSWSKELKAGGGGSGGPEAVLAALRHAGSDLQWRSDSEKAIIVITDAGPHRDGDCCNAEGDTLEGTIFGLAGQGARVYVIGPENAALKKIAGDTGGSFYRIRSGLSLKPLLKEITGGMSCSFQVEAEATCLNRTLAAKVRLVGKEAIPFVAGQTEAWMYLQSGNRSRYNLSYDQAAGAYLAKVPDVCGPVELTVYGRAGERSAVLTVQVDCGSCVTEEPSQETSNQPPIINDLVAVQDKGTAINWTAEARDPEDDPILYRFILNSKAITDWITENEWTLNTADTDVGDNKIEVQIRDGKHKGSDSYDDFKSVQFKLSSMKLLIRGWNKTLGGSDYDLATSVQQTSDGGYIIIGMTVSFGAGGKDFWLIKTDAYGNKLWDRTLGGSNDDKAYSGQQTNDGGYIIAGTTRSYGAGGDDIWVIKIDSLGNKEWDKTFGGSKNDMAWSVKQTSDGGYIITGWIDGNNNLGAGDVWLIKTDSSGNKEWDKIFSGSSTDVGWSVKQTNDGGYIIAGQTTSYGTGGFDIWLIKTDSSGNKEWDRTFGGWNREWPGSVQQTNDGGYIIAGFTHSYGAGGEDAWLIKTDSSGNKEWDRTFGGSNDDSANSVQQTNDGGYIIAGSTSTYGAGGDDIWVIKTDSKGKMEGRKTFGGSNYDTADSVQQTNDGGYIIAGTTSSYGAGGGDVWLIKTDANGNV